MGTKGKGGGAFLKGLGEKLKGNRKLELLVYGCIILAVLLLYISTVLPKKETKGLDPVTLGSADVGSADLETRLKTVLSSIRGAGAVEVMITYETGPEIVPAMSTDVNSNTTDGNGGVSSSERMESSKPATKSSSGGTEPIVLTEKQPAVRGVIVVAEGAADVMVKLDLERAVETVLNIPAASIEVFELAPREQ